MIARVIEPAHAEADDAFFPTSPHGGNTMQRRTFLRLTGGALAAGTLAGCMRGLAHAGSSGAVPTTGAQAFVAARRYAQTRFGRIAYVERGRGEAALFLHGFPLNGFQWRGALDRLSAHRRCIVPDLLGMGHTEVAAGQSLAPAEQVEMLLALLDALGAGRVDLVANDSGGAVAQLLAAHHPQRVRTLLLTNCDTEGECPPAAMAPVIELARQGRFVQEWLAPWLADKTLARSPQGLGGMTYSFPQHPTDEAIDMYLTPLVRDPGRTHAYALALERNSLAGIEPLLRRSTVPTRIVWGMADTIFSPASADYLDRTLGASRGVRKVEGAKLFFPEEYPDLIAEEARRLWGVA